ncbi:orotate phosphoribosyltransferase [Tumebacillus sp. DT12]|uniref:Orotate phosphoribosyltransferase n=1 Tax=Tumebacillus lacus TaxID=2995335 RepID=A0ABT3WUL6_9BACL|nr:orotate phosphoribosyltransferase [Tumebacillus lacus]MCX7568382.1 orotate phosphoribosyltransferase [Tumebacillus lacus]
MTTELSARIAKSLLEIQAVALRPHEPFTWSSGIRSPIYCDNRLTMGYPEIREMIADGFAELIKEKYGDVDVIAGTATAGIPHAAWVAHKLGKPMIYVRSSAKKHGKGNLIEGVLRDGQKVVVIEDLISTGGSSIQAVQGVREAGGEVIGVAAIFTYEFPKASAAFAEAGVPFATLSSYSALLPIAAAENYISADDVELLQKFREAPEQY